MTQLLLVQHVWLDVRQSAPDSRVAMPVVSSVCPWVSLLTHQFPWMLNEFKSVALLNLGLACCGSDSVGEGLSQLEQDCGDKFPLNISWAFDTASKLKKPLQWSGRIGDLRIGRKDGDILTMDFATLAPVHVLVAGPPCPPWSSIGKKGFDDDPRALVFRKVLELAKRQKENGELKAVILENVSGMDCPATKDANGRTALGRVVDDLTALGLSVRHWKLNTNNYSLPQTRTRLYIVAVVPSAEVACPLPKLLPIMPQPLALMHFLEAAPRVDVSTMPKAYQANLQAWMELVAPQLADSANRGKCVCFDVGRKPNGFKGGVNWDEVTTLTTKNMEVMVLGLGEGQLPQIFRYLSKADRAALQGYKPEILNHMTKCGVVKALGNSFSVPVIMCVMGHVLKTLNADAAARKRRPPASPMGEGRKRRCK